MIDLKMGDDLLRVRFDDWMFLQPDGVLLNRARVSKWGIEIGQVTLVFKKKRAEDQDVSRYEQGARFEVVAGVAAAQ